MYQSTTPSLSQTIWPRWASRQFLTLPIIQTLLPVTFRYSLSSKAVVMRQLRRWKRLWRRSLTRWYKRTSMGLSEVVGTVEQVDCSRRRLLGRGLEFHVCTINKSAHTKKVWKLIWWFSYIYIYIYIHKDHSKFLSLAQKDEYNRTWCNGYRRKNWTRRHEFKSWTWLIAFHIALIPLGKVWIQLFSLQLWVNSRAD